MKKLLVILVLFLGVSGFSSAQTDAEIALSKGTAALASSKTSGTYNFTMPSHITADDIAKNAKYYTHYLTPTYNDGANEVTIVMVDNSEKSRAVITRFLTACGMKAVNVDGKNIDLMSFMESYLK